MSKLMPPLSVVIATTQPWPEIRSCLDSLYAQACEMGAEIIVADGDGRGLPDTESRYPQVRWLKAPGATAFQLRALGMAAARADIVAVAEDHCQMTPGWCRQILQAHREWPDAAVIGGAVENGASEHLSDWANFLVANGAFLLPIPTGEREDVTGQANISDKRRVHPAEYPAIGMVEAHYKQFLRERGEQLVSDDRIVVEHVQSLRFLDGKFSYLERTTYCAKSLYFPAELYGKTAR